jgi:hypothetical protein
MIKRKAFESEEPLVVVSTTPVDLQDGGATVHLGENASNNRNINLSGWLNKDIDDWVWAVVSTLRALERSKTVTGATIVGYGQSGAPVFFTFLIQNRIVSKPAELTRAIVVGYVDWLKVQTQWSQNSQKAIYTRTKSVLVALQRRSIVPSGKGMFPANPFPGSNAKTQGESVLSPGERLRLIQALRGGSDHVSQRGLGLHRVPRAGCPLSGPGHSYGGQHCATAGVGPRQPECPPHGYPACEFWKLSKRRGNATNLKSLRFSKSDEIPVTVPMDGVALLSLILQRTQGLAAQAPANIRDRVWLYRSEGNLNAGQITCLRKDSLGLGIQSFVQRHQIQDDAGKPLRVNLQRLRKTMEKPFV